MYTHLILSIHSEDKPGVVKAVAKTVSSHSGNWLESRFSQLGGMFAGIVRIQVESKDEATLKTALVALKSQGIFVDVHAPKQRSEKQETKKVRFHALGPDKPGIVKEFTHVFSEADINIEEINSTITSMPYSGDPLFEADGVIALSPSTDIDAVEEKLSSIADAIGVDFKLTEIE